MIPSSWNDCAMLGFVSLLPFRFVSSCNDWLFSSVERGLILFAFAVVAGKFGELGSWAILFSLLLLNAAIFLSKSVVGSCQL